MLRDAGPGGVCSTVFLDERIPRFSAHIHLLRRDGYVIDRTPCSRAEHRHRSRQWSYELVAGPGPVQLELGGR